MNLRSVAAVLLLASNASAQTPVTNAWKDLDQLRASIGGVHQEFARTNVFKLPDKTEQASRQTMIVDMSHGLWRETSHSGSGDYIRVFDGMSTFFFEEGLNEFMRIKPAKGTIPAPAPYRFDDVNWSKAKEIERRPCGFSSNDHTCVVFQLPLNRTTQTDFSSPTLSNIVTEGVASVVFDTATGLLVRSQIQQAVQTKNLNYIRQIDYSLTRFSIGVSADAVLFKLPSNDLREVKELSRWNAARIKQQLAGKPAPELNISDMKGSAVSLAAFKGKTVLIDFWTTWCPPCRADGPDLDKLNQKFGGKELAIIGISVSEDRAIVEKFLKDHSKSYPVALTTENDMPRPYQIGVFPTYIVIDENGNVTAAVEGERGFGELKKLLQKAGMAVQ